jgi:hypothetical protein
VSLVPINTATIARQSAAIQELAISGYLEQARDWLATAVEKTGPEQVAAAKAEIATAAEATKQLGLSKEIQLDAQEMVRRAEYALGKAIRKGQEGGTVRTKGQYDRGKSSTEEVLPVSPYDFASNTELSGNPTKGIAGIYDLAEATADEFDAALAEAKDEGNVSRTNVVRKIKGQGCDRPAPVASRLDEIRDLIAIGATSAQIAKELGVSEQRIRLVARENDLVITADVVMHKSRRINNDRVLDNVAEAVEVAAMSLRDIDPASLDSETALERLDSLTTSINALRQAVKKIKESFHG